MCYTGRDADLWGSPMQLVGQFDSPYVRRVAIALHLLDLPFTRNPISVFRDADAMRRINPLGRVPSLILEDGEVLIDSLAILDHLDELVGPERALMPPKGGERRQALRRIALATGAMDKAVAVVYESIIRPADKIVPAWLARLETQLSSAIAALELECGKGWPLDKRPMQPEITAACLVGFLKLRVPKAFPAAHYPALARLAAAMEKLPAFKATRPSANESIPSDA